MHQCRRSLFGAAPPSTVKPHHIEHDPSTRLSRRWPSLRPSPRAAEGLGYDCIEVADHVFGAAPRGDWKPPYTRERSLPRDVHDDGLHRGRPKNIKLCSGVLILPQRQTGVVAKQAAEVDILSGGRLRLGVGVGWNHVEYEALGMEWKTRGARQAEQIEVMRRLWTEDLVTFKGKFHDADRRQHAAGAGPAADPDLVRRIVRRCGQARGPHRRRLDADPVARSRRAKLAALREHLEAFGRDPAKFGLEGWLRFDEADPQRWAAAAMAGSGWAPRW